MFSDLKEVVEEIIDKDKYPFCFLFVGVGEGNFEEFDIFNQENLGGITDRSLTKFVHCPDKEKLNDPCWMDSLLDGIPEQFLELMNILSRYSDK